MFKRLRSKLLKQHNLGNSIGGIKNLSQHTMFYVTAVNFILLVITAYSVSLRSFMSKYVDWFNFPIFVGLLIAILLFAMLIEYKFILPSTMSFINRQTYKHRNPLKKELEKIGKQLNERLDKMNERLDSMEEKMAKGGCIGNDSRDEKNMPTNP